jgi:hypothetical protein
MNAQTYHFGKKKSASVIHASTDDGRQQAVGINLRVLIVPDGKFWYAQGIEIDYGAQGTSVEDAKEHFEQGLSGTVRLHLQKHGHIEKLLRHTSGEALKEAREFSDKIERFVQVSFHDIDAESAKVFPYPEVEYYRLTKAA